jgi:hypothetical protein
MLHETPGYRSNLIECLGKVHGRHRATLVKSMRSAIARHWASDCAPFRDQWRHQIVYGPLLVGF